MEISESSLIEVLFRDGTRGRVAPRALDLLLRFEKIDGFHRSGGWAKVGVDPIRSGRKAAGYRGPERRAA